MTFFELNFRKTLTLGVEVNFREDAESGLGFKIGPTQPELEKAVLWTLIADPAVAVSVGAGAAENGVEYCYLIQRMDTPFFVKRIFSIGFRLVRLHLQVLQP